MSHATVNAIRAKVASTLAALANELERPENAAAQDYITDAIDDLTTAEAALSIAVEKLGGNPSI